MKLPLQKRAKNAPAEATLSKPAQGLEHIKKSKIVKAFKLPKASRFVLNIGDEGAILIHYKAGVIEGRWFASNASAENSEVFAKALSTDSSAPILIVLDTVDQTYSQQTLPPVSKMNLNGLLKRRIRREFGDIELKGSYPIGKSENKEWNFMLYAIEQNEYLQQWMQWVLNQGKRPLGIRVLPMEMAVLSKRFYDIYRAKKSIADTETCQWKFIVSHNKVSGFRQVIVKDDYMIFTRLGQPLDGGADVQAGMIEQEVTSTLEYLKRIGLKSFSDIHLTIIAAEDIVRIIDLQKIGVSSNLVLNPYQAAKMFDWEDISQPEDKFGDVFLSVFSLVNQKSIAKLWTAPLEKLKKIYMIRPAVRGLGALVSIAALGYSGLSAYDWWQYSEKLSVSQAQSKQLSTNIDQLKSASEIPPEELEKILSLFDLYKLIRQQALNPKDFMVKLSTIFTDLPNDMLVQEISWEELSEKDAAGNAIPAGTSDPSVQPTTMTGQEASAAIAEIPKGNPIKVNGVLNIDMMVPADIKGEALQSRVQAPVIKIQPLIPHYMFQISEVPGAKTATDSLSIDLSAPTQVSSDLSPITIKTKFTGTEYIPEPTLKRDN